MNRFLGGILIVCGLVVGLTFAQIASADPKAGETETVTGGGAKSVADTDKECTTKKQEEQRKAGQTPCKRVCPVTTYSTGTGGTKSCHTYIDKNCRATLALCTNDEMAEITKQGGSGNYTTTPKGGEPQSGQQFTPPKPESTVQEQFKKAWDAFFGAEPEQPLTDAEKDKMVRDALNDIASNPPSDEIGKPIFTSDPNEKPFQSRFGELPVQRIYIPPEFFGSPSFVGESAFPSLASPNTFGGSFTPTANPLSSPFGSAPTPSGGFPSAPTAGPAPSTMPTPTTGLETTFPGSAPPAPKAIDPLNFAPPNTAQLTLPSGVTLDPATLFASDPRLGGFVTPSAVLAENPLDFPQSPSFGLPEDKIAAIVASAQSDTTLSPTEGIFVAQPLQSGESNFPEVAALQPSEQSPWQQALGKLWNGDFQDFNEILKTATQNPPRFVTAGVSLEAMKGMATGVGNLYTGAVEKVRSLFGSSGPVATTEPQVDPFGGYTERQVDPFGGYAEGEKAATRQISTPEGETVTISPTGEVKTTQPIDALRPGEAKYLQGKYSSEFALQKQAADIAAINKAADPLVQRANKLSEKIQGIVAQNTKLQLLKPDGSNAYTPAFTNKKASDDYRAAVKEYQGVQKQLDEFRSARATEIADFNRNIESYSEQYVRPAYDAFGRAYYDYDRFEQARFADAMGQHYASTDKFYDQFGRPYTSALAAQAVDRAYLHADTIGQQAVAQQAQIEALEAQKTWGGVVSGQNAAIDRNITAAQQNLAGLQGDIKADTALARYLQQDATNQPIPTEAFPDEKTANEYGARERLAQNQELLARQYGASATTPREQAAQGALKDALRQWDNQMGRRDLAASPPAAEFQRLKEVLGDIDAARVRESVVEGLQVGADKANDRISEVLGTKPMTSGTLYNLAARSNDLDLYTKAAQLRFQEQAGLVAKGFWNDPLGYSWNAPTVLAKMVTGEIVGADTVNGFLASRDMSFQNMVDSVYGGLGKEAAQVSWNNPGAFFVGMVNHSFGNLAEFVGYTPTEIATQQLFQSDTANAISRITSGPVAALDVLGMGMASPSMIARGFAVAEQARLATAADATAGAAARSAFEGPLKDSASFWEARSASIEQSLGAARAQSSTLDEALAQARVSGDEMAIYRAEQNVTRNANDISNFESDLAVSSEKASAIRARETAGDATFAEAQARSLQESAAAARAEARAADEALARARAGTDRAEILRAESRARAAANNVETFEKATQEANEAMAVASAKSRPFAGRVADRVGLGRTYDNLAGYFRSATPAPATRAPSAGGSTAPGRIAGLLPAPATAPPAARTGASIPTVSVPTTVPVGTSFPGGSIVTTPGTSAFLGNRPWSVVSPPGISGLVPPAALSPGTFAPYAFTPSVTDRFGALAQTAAQIAPTPVTFPTNASLADILKSATGRPGSPSLSAALETTPATINVENIASRFAPGLSPFEGVPAVELVRDVEQAGRLATMDVIRDELNTFAATAERGVRAARTNTERAAYLGAKEEYARAAQLTEDAIRAAEDGNRALAERHAADADLAETRARQFDVAARRFAEGQDIGAELSAIAGDDAPRLLEAARAVTQSSNPVARLFSDVAESFARTQQIEALRSSLSAVNSAGPVRLTLRADGSVDVFVNGKNLGEGLPSEFKFCNAEKNYCAWEEGEIGLKLSRANEPEFPATVLHEKGHALANSPQDIADFIQTTRELGRAIVDALPTRAGKMPRAQLDPLLQRLFERKIELTARMEADAWKYAMKESVPLYAETGVNALARIDAIAPFEESILSKYYSHRNGLGRTIQVAGFGERTEAYLLALNNRAFTSGEAAIRETAADARSTLAQTTPRANIPIQTPGPVANYIERIAAALSPTPTPSGPWLGSDLEEVFGLARAEVPTQELTLTNTPLLSPQKAAAPAPSQAIRSMLLARPADGNLLNVAHIPELERLTGNGNIDIPYGDPKGNKPATFGSQHIAFKHPNMIQDGYLDDLLSDKATVSLSETKGAYVLKYEDPNGGVFKAVVAPSNKPGGNNMLITAFRQDISIWDRSVIQTNIRQSVASLRARGDGRISAVVDNRELGIVALEYGKPGRAGYGLASIDPAVDPFIPELLTDGRPVWGEAIISGRLSTTNPGASLIIESMQARGVVRFVGIDGEQRAWLASAEIKRGPARGEASVPASEGLLPTAADRSLAAVPADASRSSSISGTVTLSSSDVPPIIQQAINASNDALSGTSAVAPASTPLGTRVAQAFPNTAQTYKELAQGFTSTANANPVEPVIRLAGAAVRDVAGGVARLFRAGTPEPIASTAVLSRTLGAPLAPVHTPARTATIYDGIANAVRSGRGNEVVRSRGVVDSLITSNKAADIEKLFSEIPALSSRQADATAVKTILQEQLKTTLEPLLIRSNHTTAEALFAQSPELWVNLAPVLDPAALNRFLTQAERGGMAAQRLFKNSAEGEELFLRRLPNGEFVFTETIPATGADTWKVASREVPVAPHEASSRGPLTDGESQDIFDFARINRIERTSVDTRFVGAGLDTVLPLLDRLGLAETYTAVVAERHAIIARLADRGVYHGHVYNESDNIFTHDANFTVEFAQKADIDAALSAVGRAPLPATPSVGDVLAAADVLNGNGIPVTQSLARGLSEPGMVPIVRLRDWGQGQLVRPQDGAQMPATMEAVAGKVLDDVRGAGASAAETAVAQRALTHAIEATDLYAQGRIAEAWNKVADARQSFGEISAVNKAIVENALAAGRRGELAEGTPRSAGAAAVNDSGARPLAENTILRNLVDSTRALPAEYQALARVQAQHATEASADWAAAGLDYHEPYSRTLAMKVARNPVLSETLFKAPTVIDLGAGNSRYISSLAGGSGTQYIAVDVAYPHGANPWDFQVTTGSNGVRVGGDMLSFLSTLKDGSVARITGNGLDTTIIPSQIYTNALAREIGRVLAPDGYVFGIGSEPLELALRAEAAAGRLAPASSVPELRGGYAGYAFQKPATASAVIREPSLPEKLIAQQRLACVEFGCAAGELPKTLVDLRNYPGAREAFSRWTESDLAAKFGDVFERNTANFQKIADAVTADATRLQQILDEVKALSPQATRSVSPNVGNVPGAPVAVTRPVEQILKSFFPEPARAPLREGVGSVADDLGNAVGRSRDVVEANGTVLSELQTALRRAADDHLAGRPSASLEDVARPFRSRLTEDSLPVADSYVQAFQEIIRPQASSVGLPKRILSDAERSARADVLRGIQTHVRDITESDGSRSNLLRVDVGTVIKDLSNQILDVSLPASVEFAEYAAVAFERKMAELSSGSGRGVVYLTRAGDIITAVKGSAPQGSLIQKTRVLSAFSNDLDAILLGVGVANTRPSRAYQFTNQVVRDLQTSLVYDPVVLAEPLVAFRERVVWDINSALEKAQQAPTQKILDRALTDADKVAQELIVPFERRTDLLRAQEAAAQPRVVRSLGAGDLRYGFELVARDVRGLANRIVESSLGQRMAELVNRIRGGASDSAVLADLEAIRPTPRELTELIDAKQAAYARALKELSPAERALVGDNLENSGAVDRADFQNAVGAYRTADAELKQAIEGGSTPEVRARYQVALDQAEGRGLAVPEPAVRTPSADAELPGFLQKAQGTERLVPLEGRAEPAEFIEAPNLGRSYVGPETRSAIEEIPRGTTEEPLPTIGVAKAEPPPTELTPARTVAGDLARDARDAFLSWLRRGGYVSEDAVTQAERQSFLRTLMDRASEGVSPTQEGTVVARRITNGPPPPPETLEDVLRGITGREVLVEPLAGKMPPVSVEPATQRVAAPGYPTVAGEDLAHFARDLDGQLVQSRGLFDAAERDLEALRGQTDVNPQQLIDRTRIAELRREQLLGVIEAKQALEGAVAKGGTAQKEALALAERRLTEALDARVRAERIESTRVVEEPAISSRADDAGAKGPPPEEPPSGAKMGEEESDGRGRWAGFAAFLKSAPGEGNYLLKVGIPVGLAGLVAYLNPTDQGDTPPQGAKDASVEQTKAAPKGPTVTVVPTKPVTPPDVAKAPPAAPPSGAPNFDDQLKKWQTNPGPGAGYPAPDQDGVVRNIVGPDGKPYPLDSKQGRDFMDKIGCPAGPCQDGAIAAAKKPIGDAPPAPLTGPKTPPTAGQPAPAADKGSSVKPPSRTRTAPSDDTSGRRKTAGTTPAPSGGSLPIAPITSLLGQLAKLFGQPQSPAPAPMPTPVAPLPPPAVLRFSCDPLVVRPNGTTTIAWVCSDGAKSVGVSFDTKGASSGSVQQVLMATTTFSVSCGGSAPRSCTVGVSSAVRASTGTQPSTQQPKPNTVTATDPLGQPVSLCDPAVGVNGFITCLTNGKW